MRHEKNTRDAREYHDEIIRQKYQHLISWRASNFISQIYLQKLGQTVAGDGATLCSDLGGRSSRDETGVAGRQEVDELTIVMIDDELHVKPA